MASIIKSISLRNFYNFYGEYEPNTYEFSEGVNIINADNGMGKSKIFNGILWLLRDQVYDSDTRSPAKVDDQTALKMLSDKAKLTETNPVLGVKVIFEDEAKRYVIEKSIAFEKRRIDASTSEPSHWKIGTTQLSVDEIDLATNKSQPVYDITEKDDIVKDRLVSRELQPYALLQGEAIDNIVDLSNSEKLASTVETLTNIDELKAINLTSQNLFKFADKDLSEKQRLSSNNQTQVENLLAEKERFIGIVEKCEKEIELCTSELKRATEVKEKLHSRIANTGKRTEFRGKLEQVEKEIEAAKSEKTALLASINDKLFKKQDPWLLIGTDGVTQKFSELRDEYEKKRHEREIRKNPAAFFSDLPAGSPDDTSLNNMIAQEVCYVCGRKAEKGTEAWEHMRNVRDRSVKSQQDKSDAGLTKFFSELQISTQSYGKVDHIFSDVATTKSAINSIDQKIAKLDKDRRGLLDEFTNYGGSISDLNGDADTNELNAYEKALDDISRNTNSKKDAVASKASHEAKIVDTEKEIDKLVGNETSGSYGLLKDILKDANDIFTNTKERIYDRVIESLEEKSNGFYRALTEGNKVMGGNLKFNKTDLDSISIEVITDRGDVYYGASEGFQRMKKLAVVMAIISSKLGTRQFEYPLIADAPFSSFGHNFINNFFKVTPSVFKQSVVLIKDFYDPDAPQSISEDGEAVLDKMRSGELEGKFYVNTILEKGDTAELETKIRCYQ